MKIEGNKPLTTRSTRLGLKDQLGLLTPILDAPDLQPSASI